MMRPEIHDGDAVGQVLDDAEIVRDEKVGEVELRAQVHEQVQDLRLDRHVERRDGFVADQHVGLHRERAGDADALALTARELMRIAALQRRIEPGSDELRVHVGGLRRASALDQAVDARRLAYHLGDRQARVDRRERVLKHHLRAQAAAAAVGGGERVDVPPAPQHLPGRGFQDAGDDAPERGLAATGFAHEPDHFALHDGEVDVVHRAHHRRRLGEAQRDRRPADEIGRLAEASRHTA